MESQPAQPLASLLQVITRSLQQADCLGRHPSTVYTVRTTSSCHMAVLSVSSPGGKGIPHPCQVLLWLIRCCVHTVRSGLLRRFEINALLRGGDAVRVESLSAQSDYQKRKMAHTHHKREQAEREKMQMRFRSKAETRLRVVPIQGDGRCLFRALVSTYLCINHMQRQAALHQQALSNEQSAPGWWLAPNR